MEGGMYKLSTGFAGRLATSNEMANVIVLLNSEMASYISSEFFCADFGNNSQAVAGLAPDQLILKLLSR